MIHVATLWLVSEHKEILLAQRSYKKESDPGKWGPSITGRLESGESKEEALLREVEEELSLSLPIMSRTFYMNLISIIRMV